NNDDTATHFGTGLPPDKLVHELAKAATSIFQLAIRIKAWVNMTPEERELDEEINIIRGKRCLVMDGSSSLPPLDQFRHPQLDWAMLQAKSTFYTPTEKQKVQHQQGSIVMDQWTDIARHGIGKQNTNGGIGHRGHGVEDSVNGRVIVSSGSMGSKSSKKMNTHTGNVGNGANTGGGGGGGGGRSGSGCGKDDGMPREKYRKRAKRIHPPGRCMSCDSSDTPEWRRGPDGAHYAKLLKRQNREYKAKPGAQLQFISFPFRKQAKSLSPGSQQDTTSVDHKVGVGENQGEPQQQLQRQEQYENHQQGQVLNVKLHHHHHHPHHPQQHRQQQPLARQDPMGPVAPLDPESVRSASDVAIPSLAPIQAS
ncbi:hypothetical protein BG004_005371, partial [Podila humilis]